MPDRYFLDTNIFLYSILEPKNDEETRKGNITLAIIESQNINIIISAQVINEISNCLFKKTKLAGDRVSEILAEIVKPIDVIALNMEITYGAIALKARYGFSFYDSLIVAAALSASCDVLLTEDLQDQQVISDQSSQLKIINPFNE